ncbi:phage gp6-like head-tail connector protein [Aminipila butyrica]|uniref:Phage gp6-like head-tail connector protein n=2 Tax=Aminipila butyrica TaxID=433296 RepID=A0A858BZW4_9FIRM|nr:phage gp6-like head-tail connector protein [Aminipila butyrica]
MLEEVKDYLRVDGSDDDSQVKGLISAADIYLENAGAVKDYDNNLYKLAVKILVTHWYENRLPVGEVTEEMAFSLRHILLQLKYCYGGDET